MPSVGRRSRWGSWLAGLVAGVVVVGPGLGAGSLLNLDLLVLPRIQVPNGIWGLGPELPRRVPYGVVLAWASAVVTGPVAGKVFIVVTVAAAVAGAARLVGDRPLPTRLGAGLLFGLSPFLLTRIGAGHLAVVLAVAVLPWVVPTLLRPADDLARTYLCAAALGVAGVSGGTLALLTVVVGLVADRGRRAGAVIGAAAVAQLPWIVPGVVVAAGGVQLTSGARFATHADGAAGVLGLAAGHGFWRESTQVGGDAGAGVAVLGGVLVVLAIAGASELAARWGRRGAWLAATGAALTLASAVPGVRGVYASLTATPLFGAGRESQRWLSLTLVWLAPAAALGAVRMGGRLLALAPIACALALAAPGLWGIGGALDPVRIPSGWSRVADEVRARPGPVLALPWHQYLDLSIADDRRVLNPLPDYLGGDVLTSSDPELASGRQEQNDPREPTAAGIVERMGAGHLEAPRLAALGVRWVVVLHEVDWRAFASMARDPGLRRVVSDRTVDLFEVRGWRGPLVTRDGRVARVRHVITPVARAPGTGAAVWQRAAAPGWMRGSHRARETPVGTLALPPGGGLLWFWPAVVTLLAYLCTLCACARAGCACQRNEPSVPSGSVQANRADGTT